jgi:hypothetical protein
MRIIIFILCACLLVSYPMRLVAQEKDKWKRVYTFDDAKVEISTSNVTLVPGEIGRVRFRWTLDRPANVSEKPDTQYKSRIEVTEVKCYERRYRVVEVSLFDAKGTLIQTDEGESPAEWKFVKRGGMMERLLGPACYWIEQQQSKP